jgi:hypothetical protein
MYRAVPDRKVNAKLRITFALGIDEPVGVVVHRPFSQIASYR